MFTKLTNDDLIFLFKEKANTFIKNNNDKDNNQTLMNIMRELRNRGIDCNEISRDLI